MPAIFHYSMDYPPHIPDRCSSRYSVMYNVRSMINSPPFLFSGAALQAPDRFGTLLAAGTTMWVVAQAVINIGAVVGVLPVTGIPLPFVSFGGSALVTTMLASGILVNVAGRGRTPSATR